MDVPVATAGEDLEGASPPRPIPCPWSPPRGGARRDASVVGGRGPLKAVGIGLRSLPRCVRGLEPSVPDAYPGTRGIASFLGELGELSLGHVSGERGYTLAGEPRRIVRSTYNELFQFYKE